MTDGESERAAETTHAYLRSFAGVSKRSEEMVALTFPDGARREYPAKHHRPRHRQGHFAVARQAHGRDGARRQARRSRRSDRARRQDRIPDPRRSARARAHSPRRRARARGSRADAVARHAGHHRPGDRQRLLLRFLPQPAVHAGGFRRHREKDARDHRARQTLHQGSVVARARRRKSFATRANCSRSSWSTPSPKTSRSRSTSRATGSISAAART